MTNIFDTSIARFFSELQTPAWLDGAVLFWTDTVQLALMIAVIIMLFFKKTRKSAWIAFVAMWLSVILIEGIFKNFFGRLRPYEIYEWAKLIGDPSETFSFPSGHSSFAFAIATGLSFYKKNWLKTVLFIMAAITAFTRVYISIHWTTDVLAGALNGILCGIAGYFLINWIYRLIEQRPKRKKQE